MNNERIESVAAAFAEIRYKGIIKFDAHEPEFRAFSETVLDIGSERHAALLGIIAGSQDFQLAGDAQLFWAELKRTVDEHGRLESLDDLRTIMDAFMAEPVNARFNSMKRKRLARIYESEFPDWFLDTYGEVEPLRVWEKFAGGLDNEMRKKTVVLAMKIYDLIHLIAHKEYLDLPGDIPIPCDLQVERVAGTSGIVGGEASGGEVMDAWANVASQVSLRLDRSVSLLRIDSVVWQAGQIIGETEPDKAGSHRALRRHFEEVGIETSAGNRLASELTHSM